MFCLFLLPMQNTRPGAAVGYTSFSPTLARLLTAPERITPLGGGNLIGGGGGGGVGNNNYNHNPAHHQSAVVDTNVGVNMTKAKSEITITPVVQSAAAAAAVAAHHTALQKLQQRHQTESRLKEAYMKILVSIF